MIERLVEFVERRLSLTFWAVFWLFATAYLLAAVSWLRPVWWLAPPVFVLAAVVYGLRDGVLRANTVLYKRLKKAREADREAFVSVIDSLCEVKAAADLLIDDMESGQERERMMN